MYGRTDSPQFRNLEGYEDHDIGTLFFWNQAGKLLSIVVNVSSRPRRLKERSTVHADFWIRCVPPFTNATAPTCAC